MVGTAAKSHMIKIGPVARGISFQNQNRLKANQNVILPYQDSSFNNQALNASQMTIEYRSNSIGRGASLQNKMAATIG